MRTNGIEVYIDRSNGSDTSTRYTELAESGGYFGSRECHLEVTPGSKYTINVVLHPDFHFGRYKSAKVECTLPNHDLQISTSIAKTPEFTKQKKPLRWELRNVGLIARRYGIRKIYELAFGRKYDFFTIDTFDQVTETFADQGEIVVSVGILAGGTYFTFKYATKEILQNKGIVPRAALSQPHSDTVASEKTVEKPPAETAVVERPVVRNQAIKESTFQEPIIQEPAIQEPTIQEPTIQEPIVEKTATRESATKEPTTPATAISDNNSAASDFEQQSAKARAKARALAELQLEEAEAKEQQVQVRLDKIQAKRSLLELGDD